MNAVILPAGNATTPTAPAGKSSVDPRPDAGFSDAMAVASADAGPSPTGGRAHISPIVARAPGSKGHGDHDARAPDRAIEVETPPAPPGLPRWSGAPGDATGRLTRALPRDVKDSPQTHANDADLDDAGAAGLLAGILPAVPGATVPGAPGGPRIGAAAARTMRAGVRDATVDPGSPHAGAKAASDARKPVGGATPASVSRHQLQRLQAGTDAATRGTPAIPARTPVDPAALARHLASQASAPAEGAPGSAATTTAPAGSGATPFATAPLFGIGSIAPAHGASSANAMPANATLSSPLGSPGWPHELGQHMVQLVQRGTGQIDLHLNPRELGPVQINLQLHDQTAQVHFLVTHAEVQHAVQQALPQLRDALASQGIALGDALVGQQQQPSGSFGGNPESSNWSSWPTHAGDADDGAPVRTVTVVAPRAAHGGVDLYA